ncbi:MAG: sigma-70 family RNA polymerase sigma factor [Erysipelotrichaceae bacterium]|nr:sigma-70 family RNA polymerase sigma factor [Erysipelotrichaceae bacterium]
MSIKPSIDEIYEEYYQKVFSYINSRINNYHDSEDLCEDVFTKVFKNLEKFDESKSALSTWIFNITKNTLIDFYRTRHDSYELLDNYEYEEEKNAVSESELADLATALNRLSSEERDIIVLKYYEGYSLKEIGEKMSLTYGVVKLRHNSALEKMKGFMGY